jgi:autotransporter-associated beta strand protein
VAKLDVSGFSFVASVFGNYWAPTSSGGAGSWATGKDNWATTSEVAGNGRQITTGSNALIFAGTGGTVEVSGTVSVAAGLTFSNNGYTLTNGNVKLTGNNTFTGAVAVHEGVLELASTVGGKAAATTSVSVASGATLLPSQSDQVNAGVTRLRATPSSAPVVWPRFSAT